jgi:hypothetical protein
MAPARPPIDPHPAGTTTTTLAVQQQQAVDEYVKALDCWTAGEATIRKGLSEALPPSLYLIVRKEKTMKDLWDAVVKHHQQKAQLIIVELHHKFQNEKCDEKGDVRAHLARLHQAREDLALMGEVVPDDNYHAIILGSLPISFDMFLTSITNQISLMPYQMKVKAMTINGITIPKRMVTMQPPRIPPDDLIEIIRQESDC